MGVFSKPQPKKKGLFGHRSSGYFGHSDTKDRMKFAKDRSGIVAETMDEYRKGKGFGGKTDAEDVRRALARKDSYFRHVDTDEVKKALDE